MLYPAHYQHTPIRSTFSRKSLFTLSLVETCFNKDLYGVFILGVNIKYGLCFVYLGSKVAYTGERVKKNHDPRGVPLLGQIVFVFSRFQGCLFLERHLLIE